uniref:Odorant receptor n=1 Tax=Ceracris kiangsu TaxID=227354 RepID=A0A6M6DI87_CERKI|nr:odorant receptor 50 [Ceracris kiangsu]
MAKHKDLPDPVVDLRWMSRALAPVGMWGPSGGSRLYDAYSIWTIVQLVLTAAGQMAGLQGHWDDLTTVFTSLCFDLTVTCTIIKGTIFVLQRESLDALSRHIERNAVEFCSHLPEERRALLVRARNLSRLIVCSFQSVGGVTLVSFITGPIVQNGRDRELLASGLSNVTVDRQLGHNYPMLMWWFGGLPVSSPGYEAAYLLMCYWLVLMYICTNVPDAYYVGLLNYISAQLRLLHIALRSIAHPEPGDLLTEKLSHTYGLTLKGDVPAKGGAQESSRDGVFARLLECIRFHQEIIKCVDEMESLLSLTVLIQFFTSTLVICLTAITVINTEAAYLPTYAAYLATMFYQLFIYCWYGGEVYLESERLQFSAYSCNWPDTDARFRKTLRICMARMQRPLNLTAYKFYKLSRETFLLLLNGSYSYFTLLLQMNQKND